MNMTATSIVYKWIPLLSFMGPGILVMLADTDAGSLILSAESGAVWGYKLLFLQFLLIPVLYLVQELAVRLGLATGMGHGELIKKYYGKTWAWFSVLTLVICCIGALITEFSGLIAVGELFHISSITIMSMTVTFLIIIAWTGSYRSVERIAILLGFFEFAFLMIAWQVKPAALEMWQATNVLPWHDSSFLYLAGATVGAVIMPWMIFFQQSAVLDKGLTIAHLPHARFDTALGAIVTQCIMMSMLIITAKTQGVMHLNTASQISYAIMPFLGEYQGKILFALGITGASLVATIVVSLTAAWSVGEVLGCRRSLEDHPLEAPWFYGIYTVILIASALLVISNIVNLVSLSIAIEMMNTMLLPIVLAFLFLLAQHALPEAYRLKKWNAWIVGSLLILTSCLGLVTGILGLF